MSKYEFLLQSLSCLWQRPDGIICGEDFTSAQIFTNHLRTQHISHCESSSGEGMVCQWDGCGQTILGSRSEYVCHVLFHPYHCFLKLLGQELQVKMDLPHCQYESSFSHVVQPLEVEPRCLWDDGKCQQSFDNMWEFYSHVRGHTRTSIAHVCHWGSCKFSGRDRNKVVDHLRAHVQEKVVACHTCGVMFSNNTKLKDHLIRQTSVTGHDPELTCNFCLKRFPNARLLREHTRKHINTVKCPDCELTCQCPSRLLQHIRCRHVSNKAHQCPLCHKTYKTIHSLSTHIETHSNYSVQCQWPKCSFIGLSEKLLKAHERSVHMVPEEEKLFCCHVCNSRYSLGRQLTSHLKGVHKFELPPGHCRFRYVTGKDGFKRLQTVRLDDENLYTPELNTFTASSPSSSSSRRENIFRSLDLQDCQLSESMAGGSGEEEEEESHYQRLRSVSPGTGGGTLGHGSNKCPSSARPLSAQSASGLSHVPSSEHDENSNRCPPSASPLSAASNLPHLAIGTGKSSNRCPSSAPPLSAASTLLDLAIATGKNSNRCPPSAPPLSAASTLLDLAIGSGKGSNRCPPSAPPLSAASTLLDLAIGSGKGSNRCRTQAPPLFTANDIGSLFSSIQPIADSDGSSNRCPPPPAPPISGENSNRCPPQTPPISTSNRCPPQAPPISTSNRWPPPAPPISTSNRCPPPAPPISTSNRCPPPASESGLLYLSSSGHLEEIGDSNKCPPLAPPLSVPGLSEEVGGGGGVFCDPSQDAIIAHFDGVPPHLPLLPNSHTLDFDPHQ